MIVARTLFEYINEEGKRPGNRLSKFAKLLRDKGGKFAEALLEAKEGTILAPSNEALEKVDKERLDFIIGNDYLRAEMLGLHFVRDRIISTDHKIEASNDQVSTLEIRILCFMKSSSNVSILISIIYQDIIDKK